VVNHHDNADVAEASGPREEINFWKSRTMDLSGISTQVHRADVRKVSRRGRQWREEREGEGGEGGGKG
jgi:dynein heavy chain